MPELPKDRLQPLRKRIEQQRNTIEALKREGHRCPDAERQLHLMLIELQAKETARRNT